MESRFLKKAVVLTGLGCNSNCVFCLQGQRTPAFYPSPEIAEKIVRERHRGANWLVLTGGEASIHKDFLNFVRLGKRLGYERIQTVSNGRMFASKSFTRKAVGAGLTELTISFHGPTAEKHDALTRTPGSFEEAARAALNCKEEGIKLSFNTALSSLNVKDLKDIARYIVEDLGFRNSDYDIIGTAPSGRTWKYNLMPEHEDVRSGFRDLFEYAEKKGLVVWITRSPIQDMPRGFEYHKEPWEVITHDTIPMWDQIWYEDVVCEEGRCEYCESLPFCEHIKALLSKIKDGELSYVTGEAGEEKMGRAAKLSDRFMVRDFRDVSRVEDAGFEPFFRAVFDGVDFGWDEASHRVELAESAGIDAEVEFQVNKESLSALEEIGDAVDGVKVILSPTNPYNYTQYDFGDSNVIKDTTGALMGLDEVLSSAKGQWSNVPLCLSRGREREYWIDLRDFSEDFEVDNRGFVNRMVPDLRVFPWDCDGCSAKDRCPGFFGDYVKLFGFPDVETV